MIRLWRLLTLDCAVSLWKVWTSNESKDVGFLSLCFLVKWQFILFLCSVSKDTLVSRVTDPCFLVAARMRERLQQKERKEACITVDFCLATEKVSNTTERWVFPLTVGHIQREKKREEVSLVSVFRHRMCRGLWAEIPTFAVQHSERVTATRSLAHHPRNHWCICIDDRICVLLFYSTSLFRSLKHAPLILVRQYNTDTHIDKHEMRFLPCQYIYFWHFQPSAVTPFTVCHHSFIESHCFPPLLFVVPVSPLVLWLFVRPPQKIDPIEETSLGYVSRFAMISLFFASGLVVLYLSDR